jgi:hypothetical protein
MPIRYCGQQKSVGKPYGTDSIIDCQKPPQKYPDRSGNTPGKPYTTGNSKIFRWSSSNERTTIVYDFSITPGRQIGVIFV